MKKKTASLFLFLLWGCAMAFAQNNPSGAPVVRRHYVTQRLSGPVRLDGIPDEAAWDAVSWSEEFIQHQPTENTPPSEQSRFKVLYDAKFLYIAYQCLD